MPEKKAVTTKRGQWHTYRTITLTLVLDPTLTNLNSNVIRLRHIDIEKKKIKFKKRNADPTYFSETIHANFPRLQGQPFSLYHMEQNSPVLKALLPDVDNVVALWNCKEFKRSHLYVKPRSVPPSTVSTHLPFDKQCGVLTVHNADTSFVPNEPIITHLPPKISYEQLLMDPLLPMPMLGSGANTYYQMLVPQAAQSLTETTMEPSSLIPVLVSEYPSTSSKKLIYSIEDPQVPYHTSEDCLDGNVEPTPAKRTKPGWTPLTNQNIIVKTEIKGEQIIHETASWINCNKCQKILLDPVTLPCLDSFCLKCLESYQLGATPACPTCHTTFFIPQDGLRTMPYNKFTEKVVMLHRICNQDADDKFCDICCPIRSANHASAGHFSLAEQYCLECQQKFCSNCLDFHKRMKGTSFHQVVELGIESSRNVELIQKEKDQLCPIHKVERVQVQCTSCDVLVCRLCREQLHLFHQCQWFNDDIKILTKQEIDNNKTLLIGSLSDRQNTIRRLQNKISTRETEIFNIHQGVTQKVIQLKEAIDKFEQQLRQDLDNYYTVNVSGLQAEVQEQKTVVSNMMKLERFMQELTEKGSDCDLVQFKATLCQRSDNLLKNTFTNNDIDELRPLFSMSNINVNVKDLIRVLVSTATSIGELTGVKELPMPMQEITYPEDTQVITGGNAEQPSTLPFVCDRPEGVLNYVTELDTDVKLTVFLNKSKLLQVIHSVYVHKKIKGIAVLDNEMFLIHDGKTVAVFDATNKFNHTRKLTIPRCNWLRSIAACQHNQCLYILGDNNIDGLTIYRCRPVRSKNLTIINEWQNKDATDLSVTKCYSVLVTSCWANLVCEYTPEGRLLREISRSIKYPEQCVQLSSDQFVVIHDAGWMQRRVSIVDANGHIVQSYDGRSGSDIAPMKNPRRLIVDRHDNLMVADWGNNRIELLSPTLTHLGYIQIPGYEEFEPNDLHLDELNYRLYVVDYIKFENRVFVLSAE